MALSRLLFGLSAAVAVLVFAALLFEAVIGTASLDDRRFLTIFPTAPSDHELRALRAYYEVSPAAWPTPRLDPTVAFNELRPLERPRPQNLPSQEKVELGRKLFEDPILSSSGQIACQSCHNRELGWGDGLRTSFGHDRTRGRRNAPSLFNAAMRRSLFWDGRAETLGEQMLESLGNAIEMANDDLGSVVVRLQADEEYPDLFAAAFGSPAVTLFRVTTSLAAFQATLERPSRFDRFLAGNHRALTDEEIWGLHLFRTKGGCMNCHSGPLLTDEKFHNLGLSLLGRPLEDVGRYGVTRSNEDVGRFRTPSLRHVGTSRPYMHNGIVPTLRQAVRLYEVGGGRTRPRNAQEAANPLMPFAGNTSPLLKPFELSREERDALVAFLEAL